MWSILLDLKENPLTIHLFLLWFPGNDAGREKRILPGLVSTMLVIGIMPARVDSPLFFTYYLVSHEFPLWCTALVISQRVDCGRLPLRGGFSPKSLLEGPHFSLGAPCWWSVWDHAAWALTLSHESYFDQESCGSGEKNLQDFLMSYLETLSLLTHFWVVKGLFQSAFASEIV